LEPKVESEVVFVFVLEADRSEEGIGSEKLKLKVDVVIVRREAFREVM
jgi:hypothetical protein